MKNPRRRVAEHAGTRPRPDVPGPISPAAKFRLADIFRVLSDPTRLSIVLALLENDELSVTQLEELLSLSQPAVSRSLQPLRSQHIVKRDKRAQHAFYSLNGEHVRTLLAEAYGHVEDNR